MSGFIGNTCASLDEFIEAGHGSSTPRELPYNGSSMQAVITYEAVVAHAAAEAAAEAARAAQVAGIAVAQVLDDASKLAPGLALMQNGPAGPSEAVYFITTINNLITILKKWDHLRSLQVDSINLTLDNDVFHMVGM